MDLATIKAQLASLKASKIEVPEDEREVAEALKALEAETERLKNERTAAFEHERRKAHLDVKARLVAAGNGELPLDSFVLPDFGAFVVRAGTAAETRAMLEGVKGQNPDAAEATFAATVTEYPPVEQRTSIFTRAPLVVKTIVNKAMDLGGLRQAADLKKSG